MAIDQEISAKNRNRTCAASEPKLFNNRQNAYKNIFCLVAEIISTETSTFIGFFHPLLFAESKIIK